MSTSSSHKPYTNLSQSSHKVVTESPYYNPVTHRKSPTSGVLTRVYTLLSSRFYSNFTHCLQNLYKIHITSPSIRHRLFIESPINALCVAPHTTQKTEKQKLRTDTLRKSPMVGNITRVGAHSRFSIIHLHSHKFTPSLHTLSSKSSTQSLHRFYYHKSHSSPYNFLKSPNIKHITLPLYPFPFFIILICHNLYIENEIEY